MSTCFEQLESQLPLGEACLVLFDIPKEISFWVPKRSFIRFPERSMTIKEQISMMSNLQKWGLNNQLIITTSPFIVSDFKKETVRIYNGKELLKPKIETYGTDPIVLLYELYDYKSLIGARAAEYIKNLHERAETEIDIQKIKEDARVLGESTEKVLLFYHLINKKPLVSFE